MLQDMVVENTP